MNTLRLNVAVIIPTYNRTYFLREAIESALSQSVPPIGVYVADDASTDDTPQLNQKISNLSQKISQKAGQAIACKSF
jgi:glycosyltransferase involved in cell wall biosynthesis